MKALGLVPSTAVMTTTRKQHPARYSVGCIKQEAKRKPSYSKLAAVTTCRVLPPPKGASRAELWVGMQGSQGLKGMAAPAGRAGGPGTNQACSGVWGALPPSVPESCRGYSPGLCLRSLQHWVGAWVGPEWSRQLEATDLPSWWGTEPWWGCHRHPGSSSHISGLGKSEHADGRCPDLATSSPFPLGWKGPWELLDLTTGSEGSQSLPCPKRGSRRKGNSGNAALSG